MAAPAPSPQPSGTPTVMIPLLVIFGLLALVLVAYYLDRQRSRRAAEARAQQPKSIQARQQTEEILEGMPTFRWTVESAKNIAADQDAPSKPTPALLANLGQSVTSTLKRYVAHSEPDRYKPTTIWCPICTEVIVLNSLVRRLPCKHIYHHGCIERWLRRQMSS
ncbi:hypothetical protein B0A48_16472 [Cryoendolithus antarcticus]|uniref:RING-type domain-containing protein n=1 Tax=Cryoendolithus antarcticus TaxID=1507870 RepID=A0A1V8SEM2_9PEZI|nr:hypothetical protein B0A48_16472 [Cryoendolithus antarcticus]